MSYKFNPFIGVPDNIGSPVANSAESSWKLSVRCASTANVNISSAPTTLDGITLVSGDRVLLKNQSTASQNGIYVFNGAATAMTRALDYDTDAKIRGTVIYVQAGTANNFGTYSNSNTSAITVGTTSITFVRLYSASTGLSLSAGNAFSITNTAVIAATYGSNAYVPQFTVNSQGQLTYAGNVLISISQSQIYDLDAGLSRGKVQAYIEGNYA